MARYIDLKKPWGVVFSLNIDHISSIIADRYSDRDVVTIDMLSGHTFTADVPYEEFMRLLVPVSLNGDK